MIYTIRTDALDALKASYAMRQTGQEDRTLDIAAIYAEAGETPDRALDLRDVRILPRAVVLVSVVPDGKRDPAPEFIRVLSKALGARVYAEYTELRDLAPGVLVCEDGTLLADARANVLYSYNYAGYTPQEAADIIAADSAAKLRPCPYCGDVPVLEAEDEDRHTLSRRALAFEDAAIRETYTYPEWRDAFAASWCVRCRCGASATAPGRDEAIAKWNAKV